MDQQNHASTRPTPISLYSRTADSGEPEKLKNHPGCSQERDLERDGTEAVFLRFPSGHRLRFIEGGRLTNLDSVGARGRDNKPG